MARRNYKIVNVHTKNLGSTGDQVLIGTIDKLDAQGVSAYLNNVRFSAVLNNSQGDEALGGYMVYLTTSSDWSDDYVITARAGSFGSTVNLSAKRTIEQNATNKFGNLGPIYLWMEITDITLTSDVDMRYVAETWGRFIQFDETA